MKKIVLILALFLPFFLSAQEEYFAPEEGDLLIEACSGTLYDAAGPDANYTSDNESYTYLSAPVGSYYELTFTQFDLENNFDNLSIYSIDVSGLPVLIGTYTGSALPNNGNPIVVEGAGALIYFSSDFTIEAAGFALDFACSEFTDAPTAAAGIPSVTCSGTAAFSDNSTGFATAWTWDFGDGTTSDLQNPTHTYAAPGEYTVSLTACNDNGCDTFTASQPLVYEPDAEICNGGINMTFNSTETTQLCSGILHDNGGPDGNYLNNAYDAFIIDAPNASGVTLTFLNFNLGNLGEHTDVFYVYDPNTFTTLAVYQGEELPGGGVPITFDISPLAIYFTSDHENNFSGFSVLWEADGSSEAPTAAFSVANNNVPVNSPVTFDNTSENAGGWVWDFGDGNTSTQENPAHVYTAPGTYEVNLTVSNCNGSATAATQIVTVQENPEFTWTPGSIAVTLDAGTTGTETLTLCNIGAGDLTLDLDATGAVNSVGYQFGFVTNDNGADFSWQLLDTDFNVVQESQETFAANETYVVTMSGLDAEEEYYLLLNSPEGVQALESVIWYDAISGEILFEGFLQTGPEMFYIIGIPAQGGFESWLTASEIGSVLSPAVCEDVTLTFDATELNGGVYEGEIVIQTNDPNNPTVTIPLTLTVIGIPQIDVTATDLDFGEIQVGGSSELSLTVTNDGTDNLTVTGLASTQSEFALSMSGDLNLAPGEAQNVTVTFTPTAITAYSETITLTNNAGDPVVITLTGTGVAAPSLTVDPLTFTVELIEGETETLNVNIGNVGEADLTYSAASATDASGFIFNFTTDNWGGEFSWNVTNSAGEIVVFSEDFYAAFTDYTETITGLPTGDTYTLNLFDSFGDGALTFFSVLNAGNGQVIAEGTFALPDNPNTMSIPLGTPVEDVLTVTPESGTVGIDGSQVLDIFIDSEGMATGTYNLVVTLLTNDPLQPTVDIQITLFVIAPVQTNFVASPEFVCGNLPVQFNDLTLNTATTWVWDLGDGTTSTEQNPQHTYAADGSYTVQLIACNSLGCDTLTLTEYVTVETDCYTQNIPPEHNTETITVCEGNVYDSGGPTADYLEGNNGVLIIAPPGAEEVTITFSEFNYEEHTDFLYVYDGEPFTGNFLGNFTGNELAGETLVATSGILTLQEYTGHFNQLSGFAATFSCNADPILPTANFSVIGDSVCINEPFLFIDESLGAPDSWFWDFGQGFTSDSQNPIINFTASDTVDVSLTVCNEVGCDTYIQNDVVIILDKTCEEENIPGGDEITYISLCSGDLYDSGGPDADYLSENFGTITLLRESGTIGLVFTEFDYSDEDYILIYDGADTNAGIIGFYTGNELPGGGGVISSSGSALTIVEVTFGGGTGSGFAASYACTSGSDFNGNLRVFNDDLCDGTRRFATPEEAEIDSWTWDFGDGMTSTEASPVHAYSDGGMHTVTLETCYQGDCQTETATFYSNKMTPDMTAPVTATEGEEVHFHDQTPTATHRAWDFGNGETSDHSAPVTTYDTPGMYEVHLHLTNMNVHETCTADMYHSLEITADEDTSTGEIAAQKIRVYPNPTSAVLQLDLGEFANVRTEIILTATDGKVVLREIYDGSANVSDLPGGTYFLRVLPEGETPQQFKVVIARQP